MQFALFFIDLDHFKEINDTLSHEVGDKLLVDVSKRMQACIRESDSIARLGGDEFAIIISDLDDSIMLDRIANTIIGSINEPFKIDINQLYISASVGITIFPADGKSASTLLKNADHAMYQAKNSGRARYSYFTAEMQAASVSRQELLSDLRQALENQQMELLYQPIVDLSNDTICKAEALLRWRHPQKGIVCPGDFISLAEESGLIVDIGTWVFNQVLDQLEEWSGKICEKFEISVNRSPIEFRDRKKQKGWMRKLKQLQANDNNIVIEVTESVLMENESSVHEQLLEFRNSGLDVALDDFGTGYSSLSYLKDFDIDYIKIDQSFVRNLTKESQELALCEAMIVMAHKLGLKVIAEGLETEAQSKLLKRAGCDYAQGYYYSKPVNAEGFLNLFNETLKHS